MPIAPVLGHQEAVASNAHCPNIWAAKHLRLYLMYTYSNNYYNGLDVNLYYTKHMCTIIRIFLTLKYGTTYFCFEVITECGT